MKNLPLITKYFILIICVAIIGSSCHQEDHIILPTEEKMPLSLSIILEKNQIEEDVISAFKDRIGEEEGEEYCPYLDYHSALVEVRREYQYLANERCEDIFVCTVCCLDGSVIYANFRIQPNQHCMEIGMR